jgi:uncharacterized protein YjeT (DUF2065 family)
MREIMVDTLLLAFGLVLVIEGIAPTLFPNKWKNYLTKLAEYSAEEIRNIGLVILTLGIFVIWLSQ